MSMIDDPELRELFKVESEEHLQLLDEGLLHLEKHPEDAERLHEVFREAHSLKGAARMLGINDVETLSHLIEDILGSASKGKTSLTPEKIDVIYEGLDAIRKFVHEAVTGEKAGIDPVDIIDRLSQESRQTRSAGIPQPRAPEPQTAAESAGAPSQESSTPASTPPTPTPVPEKAVPVESAPAPEPAVAPADDESFVTIELDEPIQPMTPLPAPAPAATAPEPAPASESPSPAAIPPTPAREEPAPASATTPAPAAGTGTAGISSESSPGVLQTPAASSAPATPAAASPAATEVSTETRPAATTEKGSAADQYRVDTIRVKPERLDALMTQAGELTVTRIRISRRPQEIESLLGDIEVLRQGLFEATRELNRHAAFESALSPASAGSEPRTGDALSPARGGRGEELLKESQQRLESIEKTLIGLRGNAYEDGARLELIASRMEEGIRQVRMMPLSTVFGLFPRTVRDLGREQGKQVDFIVEGGETLADKRIIEEIKDPLMHMVRNAVDHGIESPAERKAAGKIDEARLWLRAEGGARSIMIEVADDGKGLDAGRIKRKALERGIRRTEEINEMSEEQIQQLIFEPGFSTSDIITDVSGRGVGMDVVMSKIEQLKGSVVLKSNPGQGTSIQLHLPITLSTTRILLLKSAGQVYALPVDFVETSRMVPRADIFSMEGKDTVVLDENPVSLVSLTDILPISNSLEGARTTETGARERFPVVFVRIGKDRVGLIVDELIDEQEIILKAQGGVLKRVPNVLGMTILESGAVCVVLNVPDLVRSVTSGTVGFTAQLTADGEEKKKIVLLVEDSITTRMQEKRILERAGYDVILAVDGQDGFQKLNQNDVDAVVSDVEMPNMNGFELTRRIRAHPEFGDLPVLLVTTLASEEDIRTGMEAGANAYITKRSFDQSVLLETLERLI